MSPTLFRNSAPYGVALAVLCAALGARAAADPTPLGANKFDLLMQYEGYAGWQSDGSPGYRHVTHAMGRKAILDAADAGFRFFRVSVSGYGGTNPQGARRDMLRLWQSDPETYWRRVDQMFDDLDAAGLQIVPSLFWNIAQFPALTGETTTDFIRDPRSASRALAARYLREFVTRYRARKTILFYELTNEFNLDADLDKRQRCLDQRHNPALCVSIGNFTEADLDAFAKDMVGLIRAIDPGRKVTSGYGVPQAWAYHMALQPEWTRRGGFTHDSPEEFASNLTTIHRDFDIVSVHVYPQTRADRFGRPPDSQARLIADAARVAHADHKTLFLGEFGDAGPTPFMRSVKALLDDGQVDYAAVWIWEFYQRSTFETEDTDASRFSLEPGYRDSLIALLREPKALVEAAEPRIVLTWPLPCARLDKPVEINATASDGAVPVESVAFSVDGKLIGTVTAPPYRVTWDPASAAPQVAHVAAVARATSGTTSTDGADVLVDGAGGACRATDD